MIYNYIYYIIGILFGMIYYVIIKDFSYREIERQNKFYLLLSLRIYKTIKRIEILDNDSIMTVYIDETSNIIDLSLGDTGYNVKELKVIRHYFGGNIDNTYDELNGSSEASDTNFVGTIIEWNNLSASEKLKYKTADIY
jgi:hypothetical protein